MMNQGRIETFTGDLSCKKIALTGILWRNSPLRAVNFEMKGEKWNYVLLFMNQHL